MKCHGKQERAYRRRASPDVGSDTATRVNRHRGIPVLISIARRCGSVLVARSEGKCGNVRPILASNPHSYASPLCAQLLPCHSLVRTPDASSNVLTLAQDALKMSFCHTRAPTTSQYVFHFFLVPFFFLLFFFISFFLSFLLLFSFNFSFFVLWECETHIGFQFLVRTPDDSSNVLTLA